MSKKALSFLPLASNAAEKEVDKIQQKEIPKLLWKRKRRTRTRRTTTTRARRKRTRRKRRSTEEEKVRVEVLLFLFWSDRIRLTVKDYQFPKEDDDDVVHLSHSIISVDLGLVVKKKIFDF